jgi:hypothetical protein
MNVPELVPPSQQPPPPVQASGKKPEKLTLKPFDIKKAGGAIKLASKPTFGGAPKLNATPAYEPVDQDGLYGGQSVEDSMGYAPPQQSFMP